MKPNSLKVLRDAHFVIPKCCALCIHADATGLMWCKLLKQEIFYGNCKHFFVDEEAVKDLAQFKSFLDRRKFTRNNRFKAPTNY